MEMLSILGIAVFMVILALLPSTSVGLVIARSLTDGVPGGIAVSAGIVLGDLVFLTLAYAGMSALAETMGAFFAVVKYLAGAYLIWMGIALIKSRKKTTIELEKGKGCNVIGNMAAGFFVTLGDVKAILFYASLVPLVADLRQFSFESFLVLACVTIISVGGVKVLYSFLATKVVRRFASSRAQKFTRSLSGCLLIGSGSYLVLKA